jgi:hypothetical protein
VKLLEEANAIVDWPIDLLADVCGANAVAVSVLVGTEADTRRLFDEHEGDGRAAGDGVGSCLSRLGRQEAGGGQATSAAHRSEKLGYSDSARDHDEGRRHHQLREREARFAR